MHPKDHEKLIKNTITKTYKNRLIQRPKYCKKTSIQQTEQNIFLELELFITLKDHNDNFTNNPAYGLINPPKNELGKISKSMLERVNKTLAEQLKVH